MTYHTIISKIDYIIIKYGIPIYLKKWKKLKFNNPDTYKKFIIFINDYVKQYHYHSIIISTSLLHDQDLNDAPMPTFKFDKIKKISTITFYHFYGQSDNLIKKLIQLVKDFLTLYIDQINGLIIDLRYHYGGNMWPAINSLSMIYGTTTLFSFNNVKTDFSVNKWININRKGNKFISDKLSFCKPIAVIVSAKTASSGEFIAASFVGRNNVIIIGDKTAGYLSSNQTFKINSDINLYLTTALCTTVDGTFHKDEIINTDVSSIIPIHYAKSWISNK